MSSLRYVFSNNSSGRPYCRKKLGPEVRPHDSTLAVLDGTSVVFASEAERFTKVKHDYHSPIWNLEILKSHSNMVAEHYVRNSSDDHHLHHIYEAFYQSGFKEAAVMVNDGMGTSNDCLTLAYVRENEEPEILAKLPDCDSPCLLYAKASSYVFHQANSEGKFMGLAAYGEDDGETYVEWDKENKRIKTQPERFLCWQSAIDDDSPDYMLAKNFAFTLQKNFEDTIVEVVKHFKSLLDEKGIETQNLCLSGGGILNCPTNSRIVDLGLFNNYYASPQPSDGCAESIGRAFREMHLDGESLKSNRLKTAYLGINYEAQEGTRPIARLSLDKIVKHLQSGGVVAWYQGGAEFGPRALGHRSFLADPTSSKMLDALNKIKGRENWRPLAPVVPEDLFSRIFEVDNTDMCEFMLRTLPIKENWRPRMGAVCHVDGSTRPQLLKKDVNPELYDLLMMCFDTMHTPCLVNTSLNINGFPIVETPRDLCDLSEEIEYMEDVPPVLSVFVKEGHFFEVLNEDFLEKYER